MMRNSWTLRGRLQYILARRLLQKRERGREREREREIDHEIKKEELKGDEYIVGPYLRQNG